jgi:hypothetical protein
LHSLDDGPQIVDFQHRPLAQYVDRHLQYAQRVSRHPIRCDDGLDAGIDRLGVNARGLGLRNSGRHGAQMHLVSAFGQLAQQRSKRKQMSERRRSIRQDDSHVRRPTAITGSV